MKILVLEAKAHLKPEKIIEAYNTFVMQARTNGIAMLPTGFKCRIEDVDTTRLNEHNIYLEGGVNMEEIGKTVQSNSALSLLDERR